MLTRPARVRTLNTVAVAGDMKHRFNVCRFMVVHTSLPFL
jgi:hypothetical protein